LSLREDAWNDLGKRRWAMRKLILFLVMAVASLGLVALTPSQAEARYPRYYVGYSYPVYPYPVSYYSGYYPTYYGSAYYAYPTYYPTYSSSYYYTPPVYTGYYYAPAGVVATPAPVYRSYYYYPGVRVYRYW
jgi:hypothetical protein